MEAGSLTAEIDKGEFKRQKDQFRNWVTADGVSGYQAVPGRYHLYVSLACPWAHRVVIVRYLKKLQEVVSMSVLDPIRDKARGWAFRSGLGYEPDPLNGFTFLSEAYYASDPAYNARVTVPVLWDKKKKCIVSNDDDDILRMLNQAFNKYTASSLDLYPQALQTEIDAINEQVYVHINNGVYRAGFATTQQAYEDAVGRLFSMLDQLEERLAQQRYLVGDQLTEADWRLFPTLVRFDAVYFGHFKCNIRRLIDYPNLWGYVRELYQYPGVAATVNFDHIKRHYYCTHDDINPSRIVPVGPALDFKQPHGRASL